MKHVFFALAALLFLFPKISLADDLYTTALVYLAAPAGTRLERRAGPSEPWELACEAPCGDKLPIVLEYRVRDANGAVVKDAFSLAAKPNGQVTVRVAPPSGGRKAAGVAMVAAGVAIVTAVIIAEVKLQQAADDSDHCRPPPGDENAEVCDHAGYGVLAARFYQLVAGIAGAGGVVLGGVGLHLATTPGERVKQFTDAYVRRPTWAAQSSSPARAPMLTFAF